MQYQPGSLLAPGLIVWCGRRDSNPHESPRQDLNLVRLPVPPRPHSPNIRGLLMIAEFSLQPSGLPLRNRIRSGKVTGTAMSRRHFKHLRDLLRTDILRNRAASMKPAATGWIDRRWRIASQKDTRPLLLDLGIGNRDSR